MIKKPPFKIDGSDFYSLVRRLYDLESIFEAQGKEYVLRDPLLKIIYKHLIDMERGSYSYFAPSCNYAVILNGEKPKEYLDEKEVINSKDPVYLKKQILESKSHYVVSLAIININLAKEELNSVGEAIFKSNSLLVHLALAARINDLEKGTKDRLLGEGNPLIIEEASMHSMNVEGSGGLAKGRTLTKIAAILRR
ncbi:MAG: hypothetical protein ACP5K3_01380 [Candidatus Micrarchaeia archaeon]